jgi:hypothetical protein
MIAERLEPNPHPPCVCVLMCCRIARTCSWGPRASRLHVRVCACVRAQACGNASVFCVEGSAQPAVVPSGSFSTPEAGSAATRTGTALCFAGFTCSGGVQVRVCVCRPGRARGVRLCVCSGAQRAPLCAALSRAPADAAWMSVRAMPRLGARSFSAHV